MRRLSYVDLYNNEIRDTGAESFAGVMGQCPALSLFDLSETQICDAGAPGTEILAGVLEQCVSLVCIFKDDLVGVTVRNRRVALAKLSISKTMTSKLSGEGGFELRDAVKPLVFFCSHLALVARCHLFGRPTIRKSDIVYT